MALDRRLATAANVSSRLTVEAADTESGSEELLRFGSLALAAFVAFRCRSSSERCNCLDEDVEEDVDAAG
jgi:hypothetical protein